MVSSLLLKLSSPVARSTLVALSVALLVDSILTISYARDYPYLINKYQDELYITSSRTLSIVYCSVSVVAILVSISAAVACYKSASTYVLIHAGVTGVFLPALILAYFSTISSRYKVADYVDQYKDMIAYYMINGAHRRKETHSEGNSHQGIPENGTSTSQAKAAGADSQESITDANRKTTLGSFINNIDSLQAKFSCCGVESAKDWIAQWNGFIAPSCCKTVSVGKNTEWANSFQVDPEHEFKFCEEGSSHQIGCLLALKEDEQDKYAWLSELIVFMIVIVIGNTIVSLLLFGLTKTENSPYDSNEHELSMVRVSDRPRLSQPTITSIKPRKSVVTTLGANTDLIAARAQAVRFNISNSPRTSISGPSKFSAGARRGSSFI